MVGVRGEWRVDPAKLGQPFRGRAALLSPFDRLFHDRKRVAELFEFDRAAGGVSPRVGDTGGKSPRKANTPVLTRAQIVAAAIALVDRDCLTAISMRRLAAELGVEPMSLYYHVPDRAALDDLIFDAVLGEVAFSGDDPGLDVEERLTRLGHRPPRRAACSPQYSPHHAEPPGADTRATAPGRYHARHPQRRRR